MKSGLRVIDGDAHMQEPMDIWERYTDSAFKDRIPAVIGHRGKCLFDYGPSEPFPDGHTYELGDVVFGDMEERYGEAFRSWWSLPTRLQHMDQEGVDIQVAFPTNGSVATLPSIKDYRLQAALVRAYNDWATDFCRDSGGRVQYIAQVPLKDLDQAIGEIRRVGPRPEATAVMMMGFADDSAGKLWSDHEYDVLWRALAEQGFAAAFHWGGSQQNLFSDYHGEMYAVGHAISFPVDCMLAIGDLIFGETLERFPAMRCGFYEANAGWVPFWLARMDDHAVGRQGRFTQGRTLRLKSSEYFQRQCYVACDVDEGTLSYTIEYLNGDSILFNTDYPHPDAPFPGAVDQFLSSPLSEEHKSKILWDNSVALYGERVLSGK